MATSSNPFDVNNGAAAAPTANQPQAFQAVTSTVDPAKETVSGQLNTLMQEDNPLMQQARAQATQGMAARGLINSSMNQGAGVAAMLDRATPIATADANVYSGRATTNVNNQNTVGLSNTAAVNQFGLQGNEQSFTAGQTAVTQNFQAAQSQLDRAQQTSLADKSIEAQQALVKAQQNFDSAQNALNREQQTALQTGQQTFAAGQTELDRAQQTALQTGQQTFAAAQNAIQNTFVDRQAELQRQGQSALQAKDIASREAMTALEQAGITNRFDKELALKSGQFSIEQANINARQARDNEAKLTQMGYQYTIDQAKIPTAFAAQISNTAMQGVNTIMADSALSSTTDGWITASGAYTAGTGTPPPGTTPSSPKTRAVQNVINYANAQIDWASKFYGTEVPPISATAPSQEPARPTIQPVFGRATAT